MNPGQVFYKLKCLQYAEHTTPIDEGTGMHSWIHFVVYQAP